MNPIEKDPKNFILPNFCFLKKYTHYVFLDSSIISTTEKAQDYFFEILQNFESCFQKKTKPFWRLLIPFNYESDYRDEKGNWGKWSINKETKEYTLNKLRDYFWSFFNGYLRSHCIPLANHIQTNSK